MICRTTKPIFDAIFIGQASPIRVYINITGAVLSISNDTCTMRVFSNGRLVKSLLMPRLADKYELPDAEIELANLLARYSNLSYEIEVTYRQLPSTVINKLVIVYGELNHFETTNQPEEYY